MSKPSNEKICVVCGDRSLGFNFNVISCESCKAFFRRNAVSNKRFTCPFANNCEITVITRRFCQKCRLEKCFKVGMKKEYIMSEEDKELKRIKIEQNRSKRKLKTPNEKESDEEEKPKKTVKIKEEQQWSPISATSPISSSSAIQSDTNGDSDDQSLSVGQMKVSADSSVNDIVSAIIKLPNDSSQLIQQIMKNQTEALSVMSRIIAEPSQALLLISHLIKNPADGMLIISKILSQSPLDALSVFTQFMSSPIDALQIIFKVMSSPKDVMTFMTELTKSPQNAMEIMRKFMATPNETIHTISRLINDNSQESRTHTDNEMIKLMLDVSSTEASSSPLSTASTQNVNSPTSSSNQDSDSNNNTNNYQQMTETILTEIAHDISGKKKPFKGNSIDSIINEAIKLEYNTPQMISQMQGNSSRELNEMEMMKIQELLDANCALYAPLDDDQVSFLGIGDFSSIKFEAGQFFDPILMKVINLTAVAIRRLIKMSKKISGFKRLCQEDQIALLKGGCTEMMILRSVMQYDSDQAFWKIPSMNTTNLKADILKLCPNNIYNEHENFIKTFDLKLRTDERIILILCAITLFCPERQNVIHRDVCRLEQNSYYFLLRRYLESQFEGCEARSIFLQLLRKIQEVRRLNEEVISVYLDVNPSQVEPLLREIFDLKV